MLRRILIDLRVWRTVSIFRDESSLLIVGPTIPSPRSARAFSIFDWILSTTLLS
jgi:hypothetical protein